MKDSLKAFAATPDHPRYGDMIKREVDLYERGGEMRTPFGRDYTRIIHSAAFRRLKHKTQAFYSPQNDHICTRIEHVNHVESLSYTIANYLGLNTELTKAIAVAHDLGHPPFGHKGERTLNLIARRDLDRPFWHEQHGLFLVDRLEVLEDFRRDRRNLSLTYAVRDGIVSHCGEVDDNGLFPREDAIDLYDYIKPNQYPPFTFEGCVVKLADKISYVGRDIEDALALRLLDPADLTRLCEQLSGLTGDRINNTILINYLVTDLCETSSAERGVSFSHKGAQVIDMIKDFNTKNIYSCARVKQADQFFDLALNTIYETFKKAFDGQKTVKNLVKMQDVYGDAARRFLSWLKDYWVLPRDQSRQHTAVFDSSDEVGYCHAILCYISGMTDQFAMDTYHSIICFQR